MRPLALWLAGIGSFAVAVGVWWSDATPAVADEPPPANAKVEGNPQELEKKAVAILGKYCAACHTKTGTDPKQKNNKFHWIDDPAEMREEGQIDATDPSNSSIYQRIVDGTMPAKDASGKKPALNEQEKATLLEWLQRSSPARPGPGPNLEETPRPNGDSYQLNQYILGQIQRDILSVAENDPRSVEFLRYFTTTHVPAGETDASKQNSRAVLKDALSKAVNSLSWRQAVVPPKAIDPHETVFRVDIRHYDWTTATWDAIVAAYPYRVQFGTRAGNNWGFGRWGDVYSRVEIPYFRADWFVAVATQEPLYSQILRLPPTDRLLEQLLLRTDVLANLADGSALRSGFMKSGVSARKDRFRLVERHPTPYGAYYKSYDFAAAGDTNDLRLNPFGPKSLADATRHLTGRALDHRRAFAGEDQSGVSQHLFQHAGGELIFHLPNGLQGYMLVDKDGRKIDSAPETIVADDQFKAEKPTPTIVNGFSCIRCHDLGMKVLPAGGDMVRNAVLANNGNVRFNRTELDAVRSQYPPANVLNRWLDRDGQQYLTAEQALRLSQGQREPIGAAAARYNQALTLDRLAEELLVSRETLLAAIAKDQVFAANEPPQSRDVYEKKFSKLVKALERHAPTSEWANARFFGPPPVGVGE